MTVRGRDGGTGRGRVVGTTIPCERAGAMRTELVPVVAATAGAATSTTEFEHPWSGNYGVLFCQ
jgi:hypothetical protein